MTWPDGHLLTLAITIAVGLPGVLASGHALLNKRRPRSAFGWIAVCLTFPVVGAGLYFLFGVNRTRRRARRLREDSPGAAAVAVPVAAAPGGLEALDALGASLSGQALLGGNSVTALHNGEAAYPAMLAAINDAERQVLLATYIFDTDATGKAFADALGHAAARGVEVCVLLDGFGELYSFPRARRMLRKRGVTVVRFLPPRLLPPSLMVNLRNHRKLLLVDGSVAFTGGMNIGDRHLAEREDQAGRVVDVHFRLRGPIVSELQAVFHSDWAFAGGGALADVTGAAEMPGAARCRVVADGPDEPLDRLLLLLVGAVGQAQRRVAVMTPYFVPPRELLGALQAAALRGVDVSVVLPARNNLFFVHRATRHLLWELLERGVRVYYQPGPFVHSKLLLMDDDYAQVGSANLDPRSLRLNFELTVEVYDRTLVTHLGEHYAAVRGQSREVTLADVDARPLVTRLLDGLMWLFCPYL